MSRGAFQQDQDMTRQDVSAGTAIVPEGAAQKLLHGIVCLLSDHKPMFTTPRKT